jgi:transcriptional regulator with XRE-family HTH domain
MIGGESKMITAKTLRFLRTAVGMEQQQLAKVAGVSCALISSIERGGCSITPTMQKKIRGALGLDEMTLRDLLGVYHSANKGRD